MSSPINNNNNNGAGSNNSSNANSRNVSPATTPPPILPATTSPIPHNNPMNTPNNNNININNNNSNTNGIPIAVASVPPPLSRNRPVLPNTAYNSIVPPPPSMIASGGGVAAPPPLKSTSTSPYLVNNNNNVHHVGAQFVPPSTTNVVRGPPPYTRQVEFSPTVTLHHPGMPSGSISMNNLNAASSGSNINRSAAVSSSSTSVAASGSMDLPPPPPARRRALSREEIEIEKRKRRQVKRACINCKFAHAACDDQRPCKRCVKNNLENSCIDVERKNKRKKSRREELLSLGLPFVGLDQNVFSLLDSVLPLDRVAAMLQQQQQLQQLQLAAQPAQGQQGQQQSQQQAPLQPPQPTQVQVPIIPQGQPQPQIPIPEIKTEDTSQLNNNNNNTIQASINNNNNSSIASTNNSNNNNVSNNNNNPPEQFQQHFLHPIASNELLFESLFANSAPSSPSRSRSNSINALLSCYNNALLAPPEIFSPTSKRLIDDLPFFPNILEGDDAAHNLDDASANNNNNGTNTATTPAAPSPAIPPSELIARHRAASFGFSAGMLAENERQKQEIKELKRVIADMTEALRSGGKYVAASPSAELFPAHVCVALWKLDGTLYSGNDAFFDAFKVPRASASRSRAMSSASLFGLSSSSNGNTTTPTTHYRNIVHPQAMNEVSMIFSQLASPSFTRPTNNNMVISGVIRFVEYTPDLNSHFDSLTPQQKQQMSQINEANERQWSHLRVIRSHIQCNLLTDQFGQGQHIIAYLIPLHSAHPYRIPTQPPPQQQHQQPQPMAYKPQPQPQQQQQQQHQQQQHPQPQQQAQPVATPMAGMQPQQQQQQHLQQQQSQQQQQQQGQSPSQQPTTQL